MGLIVTIGFIMVFGFLLMAFWCLIYLFSAVGGWAALGAREIFVKKFGYRLGMKPNYASEEEA